MHDEDDVHQEPRDHRMLGMLLAIIAIGCLGFGLLSQSWLRDLGGGTGFGLRTNHVCYADGAPDAVGTRCDFLSNLDFAADRAEATDERDHVSPVWAWLGLGTSGLIAIAELGLALTLAAAALGKRPQWPISPTTIALLPILIAMITGCVFVATKPGETSFVGVSFGFWIFGAGEICGIVAGFLLVRAIRPEDPDLTADAMNPDEF